MIITLKELQYAITQLPDPVRSAEIGRWTYRVALLLGDQMTPVFDASPLRNERFAQFELRQRMTNGKLSWRWAINQEIII